jgi:AcrR family transcriptional regulator
MAKNSFGLSAARVGRKESPAKRRLLDAVQRLLEKYPPAEITTTMVLEEASVARNTLYLHFDNHAALIESALLSIFLDGVSAHADMFEQLLRRAKSKGDFLRHAAEIVRISQDQNRRAFRIARCRLVAHAEKNARFSKLLGIEQTKINERFAKLFLEMQSRGWLSPGITPSAAAILIQAITLGRVVDDVASKKLNEKDWNDAYLSIVRKVILAD